MNAIDRPQIGRTDYLSIRSDIAGHDEAAVAMERKWGRGRLPSLVSLELRGKFAKQRDRLSQAIWSGNVTETRLHAEAMVRGWHALDAAATEAGHATLSPDVWETVTPDGEICAIVKTTAEAAALTRDGRGMQVWTLDEIGRLLGRYADTAGLTKSIFPGAVVEGVRLKARPEVEDDALDGIESALDADIPF
jgi:hypothetical protein